MNVVNAMRKYIYETAFADEVQSWVKSFLNLNDILMWQTATREPEALDLYIDVFAARD